MLHKQIVDDEMGIDLDDFTDRQLILLRDACNYEVIHRANDRYLEENGGEK